MGRFSLDGYTDKCVRVLNDMVNPKYVKADKQVPATLLRHCEGVAFITIIKAGMFFLSGNLGGGCVLAKVKDESEPRGWRWSGPVSVSCGGLGGGFIFGGEKIDSMIILNTKGAVRAFMGKGQVTFGGNLSLAAGPVGRDLEGHVGVSRNKEIVAAYSYSKAQGLYIGATLEGAFLVGRDEDNRKYYNDPNVTAEQILAGEVTPPLKVDALHRELYAIHERKGDYKTLESSRSLIENPNNSSSNSLNNSMSHLSVSDVNAQQLQPNWRKVFTQDGKAYYHNTITNETSWEAPVVPQQPKSAPFQNTTTTTSVPSNPSSAPSNPSPQPFATPVATPVLNPPLPQTARPYSTTNNSPPSQTASGAFIPPRPSQRPIAPTVDYAVALYDYTAQRPDELSFKASDRLTILNKVDANWWKCSIGTSTGLAPSNYLKSG